MIYQFEDIMREHGKDGQVELEADVVIVGTGAGGAPLGCELAKEGYSVIMLEEGGHHTTKDFRFNATRTISHLYRDSGISFTLGMPTILAPVGRTVGGTTTINQGTSLRLPKLQLKRWHIEHGLIDINYDELSLLYSAIEEFLFVKKASPEVSGNNAIKFLEGAEKLGLTGDYLPRNAKDCEGYGFCSFGCPSGGKQSMEKSYIPEAVKYGADVYADCRIQDILIENDKAAGLSGYFQDHGTGKKGPEVKIYGKVTILSAGTIGTPLLLFRNKLCNSSRQVGKNYHNHPCTQSIIFYDEIINADDGISESAWVSDFEEYGFVLETTFLPPDMISLAIPGIGKSHFELMSNYNKACLFGGVLRDSSAGRLIPLDNKAKKYAILYNMNKQDLDNAKLSIIMMAEMAMVTGAKKICTLIKGHEIIENRKDIERLRKARLSSRHILAMSGSHPMGTCRMGTIPDYSVVKSTLETWDVPDLYIVDASVFPSALGVNPQLTIMALSIRTAGFVDERLIEKGIQPKKRRRNLSTIMRHPPLEFKV